jgi:hypothetical protein
LMTNPNLVDCTTGRSAETDRRVRIFANYVLIPMDFANVRRCSRNSSATGLSVRSLSVTIATGKLRTGNLTGSARLLQLPPTAFEP